MAAAGPVALGAQRGLEYEVKAAFIYNFIQFVNVAGDDEPNRPRRFASACTTRIPSAWRSSARCAANR